MTAAQLAKELRITPEWLSKISNRRAEGSADIALRLDAFLRRTGIEPDSILLSESNSTIAEEGSVQSDFRKTGNQGAPVPSGLHDRKSVMVQPGFQPPPAAPKRPDVESYLKQYLDLAERVPGAVEHAYIELTEALPLEKLRRRAEKAGHVVSATPLQ
jgi:transcriptional regulator with XRE-family HTH domain